MACGWVAPTCSLGLSLRACTVGVPVSAPSSSSATWVLLLPSLTSPALLPGQPEAEPRFVSELGVPLHQRLRGETRQSRLCVALSRMLGLEWVFCQPPGDLSALGVQLFGSKLGGPTEKLLP